MTVLASDADNLYITMSARFLNVKIFIVARAEGDLAEQKLSRAGANYVVSPFVISGFRVANAVLQGYLKGKREVVVPWTMHPMIKLYQLFPGLVEWSMSKLSRQRV